MRKQSDNLVLDDLPTDDKPEFGADSAFRFVNENPTAGTDVGDGVTATDSDGDFFPYTLSRNLAGKYVLERVMGAGIPT